MLTELIRALFQAGIPIALTSYLLVWWAMRHDYLEPASRVEEFEKGFEKYNGKKKNRAPEDGSEELTRRHLNPVHSKWLAFGGGFYGVVGLLTYAVVELGEIRDFIHRYDGLAGLLSQLSIGMAIELFIDAIMNFVVALAWPAYWLGRIAHDPWIWFVVAYAAYWAGARLALTRFKT